SQRRSTAPGPQSNPSCQERVGRIGKLDCRHLSVVNIHTQGRTAHLNGEANPLPDPHICCGGLKQMPIVMMPMYPHPLIPGAYRDFVSVPVIGPNVRIGNS